MHQQIKKMSTAVKNKSREKYHQIKKENRSLTTTLQIINKKKEQVYHIITISGLAFFIGLSIYSENPLLKELVIASSIIGFVLINRIQERKQKSKLFLKNHFSKIIKN